ncbi:MAG: hypothetical protein JRE24_00535, partial [Deltaproteobacteria bacterium]|nr:hypothetical protein [Deltaproteobacteria bacterium]
MDKMTFNGVKKGIIQLRKTKEESASACKKGSSRRSNAPVPQNSIIGSLLCFLCIMFWLLMASSIAHGARVAGEKGVTPAAPEAAPPAVQPPAEKPAAAPAPEMPVAPAVVKPAPKPPVKKPAVPEVAKPVPKPPAEKPATVKPPPKAPARAPARVQEKRRPKPVPPAKKEAPGD